MDADPGARELRVSIGYRSADIDFVFLVNSHTQGRRATVLHVRAVAAAPFQASGFRHLPPRYISVEVEVEGKLMEMMRPASVSSDGGDARGRFEERFSRSSV